MIFAVPLHWLPVRYVHLVFTQMVSLPWLLVVSLHLINAQVGVGEVVK